MDGLLHLEAIPLPDRRLATTYLQARGKNPKATAQSSSGPVSLRTQRTHSQYLLFTPPLQNKPAVLCCVLSQSNWKTPPTLHHLCTAQQQLSFTFPCSTTTTIHLLPHFLISILSLNFYSQGSIKLICYSYCTKREYGVSGF